MHDRLSRLFCPSQAVLVDSVSPKPPCHVIRDIGVISQLKATQLQEPHQHAMSALRYRPWRAFETLQNTAAISPVSCARFSPRHASHPITKRAITYSSTRSQTSTNTNGTASQAPRPTSSTTSTPSSSSTHASRVAAPTPNRTTTDNISKSGLVDKPLELEAATEEKIDWTRSFHGLSAEPFPKEAADILLAETAPEEVEIKPDGIIYLPEIKYRRILNKAFGPGGWGLVPRSESIVTPKTVTREYALVCNGR